MHRSFAVSFSLLAGFLYQPLSAEVGRWSTNGPPGGGANTIAVDRTDPRILYAGTGHGVHKSMDGGRTWNGRNAGMTRLIVTDLVISHADSDKLYAGTADGVFVSVDGADSWTPSNEGLPLDEGILSLAVDPGDGQFAYAGVGDEGIYRSSDGGVSWHAINTGLSSGFLEVWQITFDRSDPSRIYIATSDGIFSSPDRGESWQNQGLRRFSFSSWADRNNPNIFFAGTIGGLFTKRDGFNWFRVSGLADTVTYDIESSPQTPGVFYVVSNFGFYKTLDGGLVWSRYLPPRGFLPRVFEIEQLPNAESTLFVASFSGVFQSTDEGETFFSRNEGLPNAHATSLALDPTNPLTVYASGNGGVYKSTDRGRNWYSFQNEISPVAPLVITVHPVDPRILYAGRREVYKSVDGGETWTLPSRAVSGFLQALVIHPSRPETVYVGTSAGQGIYRSSDGGLSWSIKGRGLPNRRILSLAFDPSDPNTLYAGGNGGVSKTIDGGENWTTSSEGAQLFFADAVAVDPNNPSIVLASSRRVGVFVSTDRAETWEPCGEISSRGSYTAFEFDAQEPATIYAATSDAGVFKSIDGCRSWTAFGSGLENPRVSDLLLDPLRPGTVYAGTANGVYYAQANGSGDLRIRGVPLAGFSATNSVSGVFVRGETVRYSIVLANSGSSP